MLELVISTRLQILLKLRERPYTISELSKALGFSKTTASYHLEKLQSGGLVERIERGKWVYYRITDRGLKNMQIRLLASIISLSGFVLSILALIAKSAQKIQEAPIPEIAKEVRPTAIPAPQDYYILEMALISIIALVSLTLFLYFRR
ncbi:MAG: winged helix-turn-helix domain-containing protein [Archaeoglobaceae archaeon]|nr:winged helix-turn-helix domain-containing protein [Archaeoglobaceae archaeon]MDW8117707.1 winged helix-turn-helix domain-containing protein [Archaeoglobaceae archaeon]